MITVTISGERRSAGAVSEGWVREQINRRRADRQTPWITVEIRNGSACLTLATPGYPRSGGGRRPNDSERRIFDLWEQCGLNSAGFDPAGLLTFLGRVGDFF